MTIAQYILAMDTFPQQEAQNLQVSGAFRRSKDRLSAYWMTGE